MAYVMLRFYPNVLAMAFTAYTFVGAGLTPAILTPEQFNALVDAISNSVAEKLKAEEAQPAPAAPPALTFVETAYREITKKK